MMRTARSSLCWAVALSLALCVAGWAQTFRLPIAPGSGSSPPPGPTTPPSTPAPATGPLAEGKALVEKAERAVGQGGSVSYYADPAIEVLKIAVAAPSAPAEAHYYLGRAYALAGYPQHAVPSLKRYLDAQGPKDAGLVRKATDYIRRTELLEGSYALSAGRGRAAVPALRLALDVAPGDPVVQRKLDAATSGLFDPSPNPWVEVPEGADPKARVNRKSLFSVHAPSAWNRLAAGNWDGAAEDLEKVILARGAATPFAAIRIALYFRVGKAEEALRRFGPAFTDPVAPGDITVLTTRVATLANTPVRAARVCAAAALASARFHGRDDAVGPLEAFFKSYELFSVGAIQQGLVNSAPVDGLTARLDTRGGEHLAPAAVKIPSEITDALGSQAMASARFYVFPKPAAASPLTLRIAKGATETSLDFEEPPAAPPEWLAYGSDLGAGRTAPPSGSVTVDQLAKACLPPLTRTAGEGSQAVSAVWLTRRFLEAVVRLSSHAPDLADLEAMRKASETHLVFLVTFPTGSEPAKWLAQAELRSSFGDRRFGLALDDVTQRAGLSQRAGAVGIAFAKTSKTGRLFAVDKKGDCSLVLPIDAARPTALTWPAPLFEPPLLAQVLGGNSPGD